MSTASWSARRVAACTAEAGTPGGGLVEADRARAPPQPGHQLLPGGRLQRPSARPMTSTLRLPASLSSGRRRLGAGPRRSGPAGGRRCAPRRRSRTDLRHTGRRAAAAPAPARGAEAGEPLDAEGGLEHAPASPGTKASSRSGCGGPASSAACGRWTLRTSTAWVIIASGRPKVSMSSCLVLGSARGLPVAAAWPRRSRPPPRRQLRPHSRRSRFMVAAKTRSGGARPARPPAGPPGGPGCGRGGRRGRGRRRSSARRRPPRRAGRPAAPAACLHVGLPEQAGSSLVGSPIIPEST